MLNAKKAVARGEKVDFFQETGPRRLTLRRRYRLLATGLSGVFNTSSRLAVEVAKTVRTRPVHRVKQKGH
jgi:hypothetical protein